ncbi:MAG: 30S ribosomal protein S6 [Candidatus Omnitrophica bacterium]|nr:30S ribosomal protein S6 [Candidatus Omnitrophota bacterium]
MMKSYEALFIIDPDKEGTLKDVTAGITDVINKNSGKIDKEETWGKQKIAYPVKKKKDGIYYKLNFSIDASKIESLNKSYKLNQDIIKVMVTTR